MGNSPLICVFLLLSCIRFHSHWLQPVYSGSWLHSPTCGGRIHEECLFRLCTSMVDARQNSKGVCVIVWSNGCVPGESCFICRFSVGIYAGCIYDASRATNASFPKRIDFIFSAFPVMCFTVYQGWNCSRLKQYFVIHVVVGSNLIENVIGIYGNSHILLLFCLWTRICFGGAVIGCWNRISMNSWLQN